MSSGKQGNKLSQHLLNLLFFALLLAIRAAGMGFQLVRASGPLPWIRRLPELMSQA